MSYCRTASGSVYLQSLGDGYPILFLHGIPTSCRLWDGVIEQMFGEFTCIAVDLPGLGRTPQAGDGIGELSTLAEAIEEIRIQCNVERWHVVGHDAGCAIAVHYAHKFPERVGCMALLTPSIFPDLKPFYLFEILRKPVLGELLAPLINFAFWKVAMRRALNATSLKDAATDFQSPFSGWRGAWRLMSLLRWGNPAEVLASMPSMLRELIAPSLIFHGSDDPAVPERFARQASELIPDSELVLLNAGHFLPMSSPAKIANELRRFFSKHRHLESKWDAILAAVGD
jgi:haloalkane dehalogenase